MAIYFLDLSIVSYNIVLAVTYDHIQNQNSFPDKCNSFNPNSIDNFHRRHRIIYSARTE